ncbi:MAG: primosomal protein N' [Chloroflexi bacterium]|nr:primosomal protein N' [Chloroflexota bacterium]
MPTYVEVAVNAPHIAECYHYHLPPEMEGQVQPGCLVEAPLGRQRVQGVVFAFVDSPSVAQTRPLLALLDPEPALTAAQMALARRLAHETLNPLGALIQLMLPSGLSQQADSLYQLTPQSASAAPADGKETQARLLALLRERGALRGRQIEQALPRRDWRAAARALERKGWLVSQPILQAPTARAKTVRTAELACPAEQAEQRLLAAPRQGEAALARRLAMLRFLLRESGPQQVSWLYAESGGGLADLRKLEALGLARLGEAEVWRDPLYAVEAGPSVPPQLTADQSACWQEMARGLAETAEGRSAPPYLLHGVTGSGKTELYLRAVEAVLQQSRQAIILAPEIALTPQTVRRFMARFPGQVGLLHSQLSPGERYDTWRRARSGVLNVIVGPRSALFAPLRRLGLIVVDECHDGSYYQDDPPYYHARQAATLYAQLAGAVCILGSATPDIVSAQQAAQGKYRYLRLPARILAHREAVQAQIEILGQPGRYRPLEGEVDGVDLPPVRVVDMRQELKEGNRSIFSRALQQGLSAVLERRQQAILFLNRRGTATYVFCRDCGHVLKCPECDLPLTSHATLPGRGEPPDPGLLCHHCGYRRLTPATCPECKGRRIRQFGMGVEKVESEAQALFPQARTLRWDYDTTRAKGAHDLILSTFSAGHADLLIGTQMLAKGLDLPLVTLVGVVLADVGLGMPDFAAGERVFQVLTQVAGRAGRSPLGGEVVLQTFQPEHYVIQAAAGHNFRQFYQQEMEYRRRLKYPPFNRLARLEIRSRRAEQAEAAAQKLAAQLRQWIQQEGYRATQLIGPAPSFFARQAGLYCWQIVLRGPDPASLLRGRDLRDWRVQIDPPSLL